MSENTIKVIITLSAPQLNEEEIQETVQNLQLELREVEGVTQADLIPIEQAPPNSKSIGGFLLGKLRAFVSLQHFKTLVSFLGHHLFGRTIEIKAEGNGKKLEVKLSRPEDLDKVLPQVDKFIKG